MTDEGTSTPATDTEWIVPAVIIGLVTDGAHSLIVAQFPTMEYAEAAYHTLRDVERGSALKIDGVVIASCDSEGKVHLGKVTDHSTKTGLKWGVVGGAIVGVIFPPSIIGSAAALGAAGAVLGKARSVFNRNGLADELADVMQPNTAGIIALVEDTAVVEIRRALDKADRIVEKAIDEQLAAEIDREAAAAKESLASGD